MSIIYFGHEIGKWNTIFEYYSFLELVTAAPWASVFGTDVIINIFIIVIFIAYNIALDSSFISTQFLVLNLVG